MTWVKNLPEDVIEQIEEDEEYVSRGKSNKARRRRIKNLSLRRLSIYDEGRRRK